MQAFKPSKQACRYIVNALFYLLLKPVFLPFPVLCHMFLKTPFATFNANFFACCSQMDANMLQWVHLCFCRLNAENKEQWIWEINCFLLLLETYLKLQPLPAPAQHSTSHQASP